MITKDQYLESLSLIAEYFKQPDIPEDNTLFLAVTKLFSELSDDERVEIMSDYCKRCGYPDSTCQCWNDD